VQDEVSDPWTTQRAQPTRRPSVRSSGRSRWRVAICATLGLGSFALAGPAVSQPACKPLLSAQKVREVLASDAAGRSHTRSIRRTWQATISTDISYCATRSGMFEIDFIRMKENAPDLQFTEKFRWREHGFSVSIDLAPDESIGAFRIGFIAPCVCRQYVDAPD
jgi:hypothetical protein